MDTQAYALTTAFRLAAAAGLNTTLPLLIAGVCGRFGWLDLTAPYDVLTSPAVLAGLALLAVAEFVGDKVPALDSLVHALQWPFAAGAGAVLFASQSGATGRVPPELGLLLGLATGGGVHATRMTARPLITALTGGLGNPAVSTSEDAYAVSLAGTAVAAPAVSLALLTLLVAAIVVVGVWAVRRGRRILRWLRP